MENHNGLSAAIVLIVILMISISTLIVVNYVTDILNAAVAWATTSNIDTLQACGIDAPIELFKLRDDVTALLLPSIYVGFPGLMIIIAMLMFIAGYYYAMGRESHSSSETTTTTSDPNRSASSGRFETGRHTEQTKTRKSSDSTG
jgi:hypothetical protein